ncbi:MAG: hypothetical protein EAZ95_16980 [Bacteroidetes bacterium]|nr:MAG: hypothetical protein EAZ95_16980 [Bacteroidota bacterium]
MPKPSPFKISVFVLDALVQGLLVVGHLFLMRYYISNLYTENAPSMLNPNIDLLFLLGVAGFYQFVISNILHYSLGIPTPTLARWRKVYILASLCVFFVSVSATNNNQFMISLIIAQCCVYASCALAICECVVVLRQDSTQETR